VVSFGLGPIGSEIARTASGRAGVEVVAAVDVDPAKIGRTVREVAGADCDVLIASSLGEALSGVEADAALHSTGSSLAGVCGQLSQALEAGLNVVSTCEELAYPWRTNAALAQELDELARAKGVRLLGAGVNPGFVMDALPLVLTAACQRVDKVEISRVVDAANRRGPLQRKVGAGRSPAEFDALAESGAVRHVGLAESAWMLIDALGWEVEEWEETLSPVVAERDTDAGETPIVAGQAAGVHQTIRVRHNGVERLAMDLQMYVGAESPHDRVQIEGVPNLDVRIECGVHGDRATAAIVVNSLQAMGAARTGLLTMVDLLTVHAR